MGEFAESFLHDLLDNFDGEERANIEKRIEVLSEKWPPLVKKLHDQGVRFGYTGNGPGFCGVSFIEMIVIDAKSQKVYRVYLSEGGSC